MDDVFTRKTQRYYDKRYYDNEKHGESRAVILDLVHKSPSHCDNYQDTEEFCTKGRTAQI